MSCKDCKFYIKKWHSSDHGECHKNSPVVGYMQVVLQSYPNQDEPKGSFPYVHEDNFCGEFKKREEKKDD